VIWDWFHCQGHPGYILKSHTVKPVYILGNFMCSSWWIWLPAIIHNFCGSRHNRRFLAIFTEQKQILIANMWHDSYWRLSIARRGDQNHWKNHCSGKGTEWFLLVIEICHNLQAYEIAQCITGLILSLFFMSQWWLYQWDFTVQAI